MNTFGTTIDGLYQETDLTGWKEVVRPVYDESYQKLVGPTLSTSGDQYVYAVEDLPIADLAHVAGTGVAQIRRAHLEAIVNGAGVGQAYERNIKAADLVLAGAGSAFMWAGMTATQYATDMGAKVGLTAAEWSAWVSGLNSVESLRGALVEQQYLEFKVAIGQCQSPSLLSQYAGMYAARVDLLMAAESPGDVTLAPVPLD